ncbi:hypothetical protein PV08_11041 [Exophiala spinifera]|uniref:Uncharacterized protein n=1 Tax=Exophiala spinifera TaxID=91928 RepID=A0A0D1Y588_9EURO|nr:uncharacterized protein PV08_11041 [Exophiala spinifera]KIW10081.1 hypothetical protein PV08_11041 [Exophiala spinifera]
MASYTASTALLEALEAAGVTHIFVNLGSDHPAILEAISKRQQESQNGLRFITAPTETVGLSAAQGFFQASSKMQAILVHVDAGTLCLGGAIHNVSRARIPVLMIAGTSPVTEENELPGSRNEFIHYIQDTIDQRAIVRGYTVLDHEIRTGKNIKQLVLRAAQFSQSEPQGPSYLTASREVLESKIDPYELNPRKWKPLAPRGLTPSSTEEIATSLVKAKSPVVVTSYLGRDSEAVTELVRLCEATGTAVLEAIPSYMNFPHDHSLYVGNHWSEGLKDSALDTADVVLVIDCDVPWIKGVFKPSSTAAIYHIDADPLKVNMSLFHLDTELSCQANSKAALEQLNSFLSQDGVLEPHADCIRARKETIQAKHDKYISGIFSLQGLPTNDEIITPHYALSRVKAHIDKDTLVLSEGISNYRPICDVLMRSVPGTYYTSGATSLGWHGGAAVGAKLAQPSKTIIAITGDGSFMFSIPSSVHWMARKYDAPFLTVILNNCGWKSPMLSAMACHKEGYTSKSSSDDLHVTFDPPCDHANVAVAAGAGYGVTVKKASEIDAALERGLETVRKGRAAVIDIWLPKLQVGDRVG